MTSKTEYISKGFILDKEKLPQVLDHAVGSIQIKDKKYRYYGALLDEEYEMITKGLSTYCRRNGPVLILENGEIISQSVHPKGCNFTFGSTMSIKYPRWSLDSISKFTKKDFKKEDYSFTNVFNKFIEFYKTAMVYEDDHWYALDAIWDMASYYWDIIDKFLVIKHEGMSGTAKSKGMKICANISFNGKKILCPTPAAFFRYRHNNKAVLCIEEAENLFGKESKDANQAQLVEYLNAGYEKGNSVPRQNKDDITSTDEFDPAGFVRIGAIAPLKGALEKRSIRKLMIKAPIKDKRGDVEVPPEIDKAYSDARDMSYICGLLNYKQYMKAIEDTEKGDHYGLANRQWILAKPLIALARCIEIPKGCNLSKYIGDFIAACFKQRDDVSDDTNWDRLIGLSILDCIVTKSNGLCFQDNQSYFIINEILLTMCNSKIQKSMTSHGINKIATRIGFNKFYGRSSDRKQRGYDIKFFAAADILFRQELITIEDLYDIIDSLSYFKDKDKIREEVDKKYKGTDKL